jgi:hypothetical protein
MNHHVAIKVAKVDITRALSILELCPDLELDEQLKLSTMEGETQLNEIVSALLEENENDEGMIEAIKAQIDTRKQRIGRLEHRIEARKNAIVSLMDCAHLTKLPLPEATVSVRTLPARPKVIDVDALPDGYFTTETKRKADNVAIQNAFEAGKPIPGVTVTNGGASLTVRRR